MRYGSEASRDGPRHGPWVGTAYRAYNELLREKLRARFDAKEGPWMDKVADVLVEIVGAGWERDRTQEQRTDELYDRLEHLLSE